MSFRRRFEMVEGRLEQLLEPRRFEVQVRALVESQVEVFVLLFVLLFVESFVELFVEWLVELPLERIGEVEAEYELVGVLVMP